MNFKESWYLGFRDRRDHISQKSAHSRSQVRIGFHPLTINKKNYRVYLSHLKGIRGTSWDLWNVQGKSSEHGSQGGSMHADRCDKRARKKKGGRWNKLSFATPHLSPSATAFRQFSYLVTKIPSGTSKPLPTEEKDW